ncbi:MAG: DUF445 domain-containing protein [Gammaproteobacteria bacterium]
MSNERELAAGLKRMRWLALGLLLLMAVVFIITSIYSSQWSGLGYIRAFAEAAMIGALADWFAVTALFRHPLGIPIPHTAIIPKRKNDIGANLARFVRDSFLTPQVVRERLAQVDFTQRVGGWLARPTNAGRLSIDLCNALSWAVNAMHGGEIEMLLRRNFRSALDRVSLHQALSALLDVLASGDHAQTLINELVSFGREQLDHNRERIRLRITEESPWWMPRFVDEEIYTKLIGEVDRILAEVGEDPNHTGRQAFNARIRNLTVAFADDPVLAEKTQALKQEFLNHPAVAEYFGSVWQQLKIYLARSLQGESGAPPVAASIAKQLEQLPDVFAKDPAAAELINQRLRDGIAYLVERYRDPLSTVISDTVASWDADATSSRIELHIGRDLQFIRINGTVVGGLVGITLYGLSQVFF